MPKIHGEPRDILAEHWDGEHDEERNEFCPQCRALLEDDLDDQS